MPPAPKLKFLATALLLLEFKWVRFTSHFMVLYFRNVDLHLPKIFNCTILNARALTVWRRKLAVTKESSCASVTNKFHWGKLCSAFPTKFFPYAVVCVIAVTYLVLLPVSWKRDVILVRIRRTVSSQDSSSCLPMSTFTSGASNATTTLYHCTRERSGVSLLIPGYLYYTREKL